MPKGTTKSRGNKHVSDKFYTTPETVQHCLSLLDLNVFDVIIEPSAGAGAFSSLIPGCLAFDLEPEHESIQQADWLTLDKTTIPQGRTLVVGNPPFGTSGSLALAFMREAMGFCDEVAFILPRSFNKQSVMDRLPQGWHLSLSEVLSPKSFTLEGEPYAVPCVFQVWDKDATGKLRGKQARVRTSPHISFVPKDKADLRVQRVGGNAGKASPDLDRAVTSNYFLANHSALSTSDLIVLINTLHFSSVEETVGPRSLPKSEFIEVLGEALDNEGRTSSLQ